MQTQRLQHKLQSESTNKAETVNSSNKFGTVDNRMISLISCVILKREQTLGAAIAEICSLVLMLHIGGLSFYRFQAMHESRVIEWCDIKRTA